MNRCLPRPTASIRSNLSPKPTPANSPNRCSKSPPAVGSRESCSPAKVSSPRPERLISVLVFDEIDANVGGRLGSVIGNKLRGLADHHQVLCITHLPQIASYADRHLTVRKEVVGKVTETKVRVMEGHERLEELAEMVGGQRITDTTRAQARELLDAAREETRTPVVEKKPSAPKVWKTVKLK